MAITLADLVVMIGANAAGLNQSLDSAEDDTKNFAQRAGSNITTMLGGAVVAAGAAAAAAVVGVGVASFDMASDVDKAVDLMAVRISGFADNAEKLESAMLEVFGANFSDSIEEAGEAITTVFNAAGFAARGLSQDELADVTKQALAIRDVFSIDITESVRVATNMVNNGLSPSFEEAFDIIVSGMQNGLNAQDDLLDTLNEYSDDFARLGFTGEEALGLLSAGMSAGALNTDKLADALNEFNIRLLDTATIDAFDDIDSDMSRLVGSFQQGEITANEAFQDITEHLRSLEDPIARNAAGVQIFGTMWEDLGEAAILGMSFFGGAAQNAEGAVNGLVERNRTIGQRMTAIWRNVQVTALLPIGEILLDIAETAMPAFEQGASFLADNLPGFMEQVIASFENIRSFIVDSLIPATQPFFNWLVGTAFPSIVTFVQGTLLPAISSAIDWVTGTAIPAITWAFKVLRTRFFVAVDAIQSRLRLINLWFVTNIQPALMGFIEWFDRIVVQSVMTALTNLGNFLAPIVSGIVGKVSEVRGSMQGIVDWFELRIVPIIEALFRQLQTSIEAFFALLRGDFSEFGRLVMQNVGDIINIFVTVQTQLFAIFGDMIRGIFNIVGSINWGELGSSIINGIVGGIRNTGGAIRDAVMGAAGEALDSVKSFLRIQSPSLVFADEVGLPIAEGIAQGIGTGADGVASALGNATLPGLAGGTVGPISQTGGNTTIINFNGSGGPSNASEADDSARLLLNAMRLQGADV